MASNTDRIFFFIGLPCSGKSSLIKAMCAGMSVRTSVISTGDIARRINTSTELNNKMAEKDLCVLESQMRAEIVKAVDSANGIVFVDGAPRFGDQAEWAITTFWHKTPTVINVNAGDISTLLRRAASRNRNEYDSDQFKMMKRIEIASKNMVEVEAVLHSRLVPYYTLHNGSYEYDPVNVFMKQILKDRQSK